MWVDLGVPSSDRKKRSGVQGWDGAYPVPSSCARHMSLCSSENESSISKEGYTREAFV